MESEEVQKQRDQAMVEASRVSAIRRDSDNFPITIEEVKVQAALAGLEAALAMPSNANLTREQVAAAVLVGRGLTYRQAAEGLGVDEGVLHYWVRTNSDFRREIAAWREALEVDIEGLLYSSITSMLSNADDMKDGDRIRLLTLSQKVAARPEDRARWTAEMQLKKEQVAIQKAQLDISRKELERDPRVLEAMNHASDEIFEGFVELEEAAPSNIQEDEEEL